MSHLIHFIKQNKTVAVTGGTVAEACEKAGYPLNLVCGGKGTCGKCRVKIKRDGQVEEVLACRTPADGVTEIILDETDYRQNARVLTESSLERTALVPSVRKSYHSRDELMPEHGGAFLKKAPLPVMKKFSAMTAEYDFEGCTFVWYRDALIDVQEKDETARCYGAAVDIGTTTVACYVYDLATGQKIATGSGLNAQMIHGADVITRNVYAQESPEKLEELRRLIVNTINELLEGLEEEVRRNLYHVVLCGNSTMQHLFFGMNPACLGVSPFVNITAEAIVSSGAQTGLRCAAAGVVEFLPLLGGFVGADTAAVLLCLEESERKSLVVDLGTNGEIAVGNYGGFLVASTACGPALEGGNIACGMRGTEGAIEKISLSGDKVNYKVIGGGEPRGLCGSAIIDAVAELLRAGLIDGTGALLSGEEYAKTHPGSALCHRLREAGEYNMAFYFTDTVYLCQKDIRQIQLAKSSIYSGCMALLQEYGSSPEEIDNLVLAGAFGNYIDIDNALYIGLLPPVDKDKILSVGNGAGQGVQSLLLNGGLRDKLEKLPAITTHVELADSPEFMDLYIMNMEFSL